MTRKKRDEELSFHSKLPEYECGLADAVRIFKNKSAFARALGLGKINPRNGQYENDRQVVTEWFRRGAIPRKYIAKIHELTGVSYEKLLAPFKPYVPSGKAAPGKKVAEQPIAEIVEAVSEGEGQPSSVPLALKKKPATRKKADK